MTHSASNVVHLPRPQAEAGSFDEWWQAYPSCRRVGKPVCRAKWMEITSPNGLTTRTLDRDSGQYVTIHLQATPEELLAAVKRYDTRMRKPGIGEYGYLDDGKYVMHPSTWLNRGAWED